MIEERTQKSIRKGIAMLLSESKVVDVIDSTNGADTLCKKLLNELGGVNE